jgi:hypothetical protein
MDPTNRPADPMIGAVPAVPPVPAGGPVGGDASPPAWNLPPAPFPVPPVMPAVVATPVKRRRDPLTIVMVVAAFVALGGVGFAAGRVTAPVSAAATGGRGAGGAFNFPAGGSFAPGGNTGNAGTGGFGRFSGGVSIKGTITEVTADHISLKLANGTTVTIPVDSNTAYHRQTSASSADVTSGTTVQVQLSAGVGGGGGGAGLQPNASGAPAQGGGRTIGPASDITIVSP